MTVTLGARDLFSGVATTEFRAAGAADWTVYPAPFRVGSSGSSAYDFRSTDLDGYAEAAKKPTVRNDETRPVTRAPADARVASGGRVSSPPEGGRRDLPEVVGVREDPPGGEARDEAQRPATAHQRGGALPVTCTLPRGRYDLEASTRSTSPGTGRAGLDAGVLVVM